MTQYTQLLVHDPANGITGDCWRTTLGCLLDMEPASVPHFAMYGQAFFSESQKWLKGMGLALFELPYMEIFLHIAIQGCHHILSGPSPRDPVNVQHSVVGLDGHVHWDPHPSRAGLHGDTASWYMAFIVRLNQ